MSELRLKSTGTIKLFEYDNTSSVTIASPASLGADRTITLPDASVTLASGTMLATDGSGASLTALNASELGSGTVPTARLGSGTASSTTILYGDQTYKTEPAAGLTAADQWYLTTSLSTSNSDVTANLAQNTGDGRGSLGSAMTESSGVFTFPSTGYWLVIFDAAIESSSVNSRYIGCEIKCAGTSIQRTSSNITNTGEARDATAAVFAIIDCDDTSVDTILFNFNGAATTSLAGASGVQRKTTFTFIRLGDT